MAEPLCDEFQFSEEPFYKSPALTLADVRPTLSDAASRSGSARG